MKACLLPYFRSENNDFFAEENFSSESKDHHHNSLLVLFVLIYEMKARSPILSKNWGKFYLNNKNIQNNYIIIWLFTSIIMAFHLKINQSCKKNKRKFPSALPLLQNLHRRGR